MNGRDTDAAEERVFVTITAAARELLAMRAIAREAIPMLLRPECYHLRQRGMVAENLRLALDGEFAHGGSLADWTPEGCEPQGYEPGEGLDWPDGEAEEDKHGWR